ncbi:unnamed protein product [Polarella glacialis]|uniref:JmjC domain-containing protein n=1 Tax=Polarella glacialis TaxID=89957 RepID=A0A813D0K0_POLGL|nr:unnamed protein product [Polarella glacialis]
MLLLLFLFVCLLLLCEEGPEEQGGRTFSSAGANNNDDDNNNDSNSNSNIRVGSSPACGSRVARIRSAEQLRAGLDEDFLQLRLQYNVLLHLVREHFRPDTVAARSESGPTLLSEHQVKYCSCEDMQHLLAAKGGWRELDEPVVFESPDIKGQPFTSRQKLLSPGFQSQDFPTATVLGDALAAQFGPDWLAEGQTFKQVPSEHCFSQVAGQTAEGPLRQLWEALPGWMQCPMVVMSTGPGGSGVALHKHSCAWLVVVEGVKHWWLYPPGGPPSKEAYEALAMCPAAQIAEAVARLRPEDRPIEITQRAGEGLFVPALWWHATFNVGPTLSVGSQFHVFDLNFSKALNLHPDSAFALYHRGCEIHKSDPQRAAEYFEQAILREPLNYYYAMNQLRFYLNLVWPPKETLATIRRLLRSIQVGLDANRQLLVLRFVIPTMFDFVEWNKGHDRLVKYSREACSLAFDAVLALTRPYLPGGCQAKLT